MNDMTAIDQAIFDSPAVATLRHDLALALRAAAHYGLGEGVCNHFSVALPNDPDKFLLNPRGLMWQEIYGEDIVLIDSRGIRLAGHHDIEPSAMFIHAAIHRIARKNCVLHTHMPNATALTLTKVGALDTTLFQNSMRFHDRIAVDTKYNGLAVDHSEGARIANAMNGADVVFLGNHGVVVCGERLDYAFDDLYFLERSCEAEVLARSTGLPLNPSTPEMSALVSKQMQTERLQSELFFKALRRTLG